MKFEEFEKIMSSRGIKSLAEIARKLNTTPQAVSNWKSRDQIPFHVVSMLKDQEYVISMLKEQQSQLVQPFANSQRLMPIAGSRDELSISDILLTIAEQTKVIILSIFISVFASFTYTQFIQEPEYTSSASILLPDNSRISNLGGLAGLASQFGVNVPMGPQADLSSPSLFPELLRSRTFAKKVLEKEFYSEKYKQNLTLLAILTHGDQKPKENKETLITKAISPLNSMVNFEQSDNAFSTLSVKASNPLFAKRLVEEILFELEALNRFFKSESVNQKINFIDQRILAVEEDLQKSEQALKFFNEQNRQISSPSLQLDQERLARNVEIQKGIFLTLKQQQELAKIEEVQEATVIQVLDMPEIALFPNNKKLRLNVILGFIFGAFVGISIGFVRSFLNNNDDLEERRKIRKMKHYIRKKIKDVFLDRRISGIVSLILLIGLPTYLGYKSKAPVFFGLYSTKLMIVNTLYVLALITSLVLFSYLSLKNKKT